jgi:hypothetical protein
MLARVEQWFAASESNAAGRLGLYRILYGLWFAWLLTSIDLEALAARPAPPPAPVGIIRILELTGLMQHPGALSYGLALGMGIGVTLLTFGLATRLSTLMVVVCSSILFAWDSSFGKVVDKYVLLGSLVPLWMLFSRWGETYSLDTLIRKRRGRSTPSASESGWEFSWPLRAVLVFIAVLYFSSGYTKAVEGSWLHNPYVLLDKISDNLNHASVGRLSPIEMVLYLLTVRAPALFVVGQYLALAFELSFPLALFRQDLRTIVFSAAAAFHTLTAIILGIGFAPMIIVLAIAVDWQALYERFRPLAGSRGNGPTRPLVLGLIGLAVALSLGFGWLLTSHSSTNALFGFLPRQDAVWYLATPFAALAGLRAARSLYTDIRQKFIVSPA